MIERNEAEVARFATRIYFNFEHDMVVFGRTLLLRGEEPGRGRFVTCFPYGKHFDFEKLQRIESLALSIDTYSGSSPGSIMYIIFYYLNRYIRFGSFQRLKKLHLCLGADDVDPSRGVELVDLREKVEEEEGDKGMIQEFVDRWGTVFKGEGTMVNGMGIEGLRIICKDGLSKRYQLRELLLENGASPGEVLKCFWAGGIGKTD